MILSGTEHLTLFLANASVCSILILQQCHAEKASPPPQRYFLLYSNKFSGKIYHATL